MSIITKLAKEVGELSDDAVRALRRVLPKNATVAQAKDAYERIMRQAPEEIDFSVTPAASRQRKVPATSKPASQRFDVSARQAAAEKARAKAARASKTKYAAVDPHPNPHPELADVEFPQGAGLGGSFAIERGLPIVGRKPFMAQSSSGYSGLSSSVPANRVVADVEPLVDLPPEQILSLEEIQRRFRAGIPLIGDKLRVGKIRGVNDRPQVGVTEAYAGPDYPRLAMALGAQEAWKSSPSVVAGLEAMARMGEDLFEGPVAGVYTAMGATGLDQSTAMMDLLARQLAAGGVTKENLRKLDRAVKQIIGKEGAEGYTGFAVDPLAAAAHLNDITRIAMPQRKDIIRLLDTSNAMQAGFPDIGANRAALTVPELLFAPEGTSGRSISELMPSLPKEGRNAPEVRHPNYAGTNLGEYAGGTEVGLPRELMFSDYYKAMHGSGYDPVQVQAYLFNRTPKEIKEAFGRDPRIQRFDQEWLDNASRYVEKVKKYGPEPYARGGLAVKQPAKHFAVPLSQRHRSARKASPTGRRAGS